MHRCNTNKEIDLNWYYQSYEMEREKNSCPKGQRACLHFYTNILCILITQETQRHKFVFKYAVFIPCTKKLSWSLRLPSTLEIHLFTSCLSNAITCSHFQWKSLNPSLEYESRWNEFRWNLNAHCMTISQSLKHSLFTQKEGFNWQTLPCSSIFLTHYESDVWITSQFWHWGFRSWSLFSILTNSESLYNIMCICVTCTINMIFKVGMKSKWIIIHVLCFIW